MGVARTVVVLSAAAAAVVLTACGDNAGPGSAATAAPGADAGSQPAQTGLAEPANFGPGCGGVPASGPGSFEGMAGEPVATAASHNPMLSGFSSAIRKANLVDTLNNAHHITVFAPANVAFDQLPRATLDRILADNPALAARLTYHVVGRTVAPSELAQGNFESLGGATLSTSGSGQDFKINGNTSVICGNVHTANATVYIIDNLLKAPGR